MKPNAGAPFSSATVPSPSGGAMLEHFHVDWK
jgi:hypothetical protein